jgi:hypothetical protein
MAVVTRFKRLKLSRPGIHPTSTTCAYTQFDAQGKRILQLSTGGSNQRQHPGKVSQTLQLDLSGAKKLHGVLLETFPELR